ncbi:MAG TPA: NADPH:quinone reductase [Pyrinomonadaceae bacterium]|nr:NADPH:quinone reductase [Pyrinomonadaceae bacterium]
MKAIIVKNFGEPEVMKLEETETPEPNGNQVLVRVKAAGVNPVDTYIRTGTYAQKPNLPYTPGKDAAGIVEKIGANVSKFAVGDRVLTADAGSGTYAEFCVCEEKDLIKLPENVSFEQGAGVFVPYATAFRALFQKAKIRAGETVLIHGASGGVGTAAIQWAKNAGATVIGTASSEEGKRLVKEQGADFVFDHSQENYLNEILEVTNGNGVEVIIEMLANVNLVKDFDVLAKFGRIVVVGNRGSLEFNPRLTMGKDASIHGLALFNAPPDEMKEIHEAIFDGLSKGFLNPIVGKKFSLADAVKAHREVIESKAFGKIVLEV